MSETENTKPTVFISYSWTTPEYQQRVLDIADRLISEAGVDVIIDEYDLKGGQDVVAFMERLKTDESISHVVVLSDATYVTKADARERGVGKEAQIISPSVYEDIGQTRVIAVVMEQNVDGKPCLPVFLQSRLYFDFSSAHAENTNWERLVRHLWDKPIREKPGLGPQPEFMRENILIEAIHMKSKWKQLYAALQDGKPAVAILREELLDAFEEDFTEKARTLIENAEEKGDEPLEQTWEKLLELQSGYGKIFFDWARAEALIDAPTCVGSCLAPLLQRILEIPGRTSERLHSDPLFRDALEIFAYEMSLYSTASLLEVDSPAAIHQLFRHPFVFGNDFRTSVDKGLTEFYHHSRIAATWSDKQDQRWISPLAQIFSQRITHPKLSMEKLTQAEALIFVDAILGGQRSYPSTVIYASRGRIFPWFLKASQAESPDLLAEVVGRGKWESLRDEFTTKFREAVSGSSYQVFQRDGQEWFLRLLAFTE